jgi:hypothetical protein
MTFRGSVMAALSGANESSAVKMTLRNVQAGAERRLADVRRRPGE